MKFVASVAGNDAYIHEGDFGIKYLFARPDVMRDEIVRQGAIGACALAGEYKEYFSENTTVLDIGAHFGGFSMWVAANFPSVSVQAWEPQKRLFFEFCANIALNDFENRIDVRNKACGEAESIGWYLPGDYKTDTNPGQMRLLTDPQDDNFYQKTQIETIDKYNMNNISMMKIDVEGMELSVLRGASQTIKRCMPLIIMESWTNKPAHSMAILQLRSMGYTNLAEDYDEIVAIPDKQNWCSA